MVCAANALFFAPQPQAVQLPSPAELINPLASLINQVRTPLLYQVPFGALPYSQVPLGQIQFGQVPLVGSRYIPLVPVGNPIIGEPHEA